MSFNTNCEPISLVERRAARQADVKWRTPLSAGQQRAYRQLAIVALGLDVPTLTQQLRARRLERTQALVEAQQAA